MTPKAKTAQEFWWIQNHQHRLHRARGAQRSLAAQVGRAHWSWRWILAAVAWVYAVRVTVLVWSVDRRRRRWRERILDQDARRSSRRAQFRAAFRKDR